MRKRIAVVALASLFFVACSGTTSGTGSGDRIPTGPEPGSPAAQQGGSSSSGAGMGGAGMGAGGY